jgi:hypothetical protein
MILIVTDSGSPALSRYRRVVVTVKPPLTAHTSRPTAHAAGPTPSDQSRCRSRA